MISVAWASLPLAIAIPFLLLALLLIGYLGVPLWVWFLYAAAVFLEFHAALWIWISFGVLAIVFNVPVLRRRLVTVPIMKGIQALKLLPHISETERTAIEAGT
ncbi:MAG TPA: hypothetical protein V6C57_05245, partial [Coleofasciculaceae cyanobacterium]